MNVSDALEYARELTQAKRPANNGDRDEKVEEWQSAAEQLKEFADELAGLVETVTQHVDDLKEAERADWTDFTATLRDAAKEVVDALS